jgi:single-strand DNA-binding protein
MNRVNFTGNLTQDPELRALPSGNSVCSLRVACNGRCKNGSTGEWEDEANYFNVTVWGAQGENCAKFLAKGRPLAVDGRLKWREYEDKEGKRREAIEIVAEKVEFLNARGGQGDREEFAGEESGFQPVPVPAGVGAAANDDDIPF